MTSSQSFHVQEHSCHVLSKLNSQRSNELYCDVVLQVKKSKFPAHRNVLAASSKYFHARFTTNTKQKYEKTMVIESVSPDAVKAVLEFLYTEKITLTEEKVNDILQAASLMRIIDLLDVIEQYLSNTLHATNCLYFRGLGRLYSLESLIIEADNCIMENFEDISLRSDFLDLQLKDVENLVSSDELMVKFEKDVYEAVLMWVKKDMKERKKSFPDLFKLVRLQHIPIEYLSEKMSTEPLLKEFQECGDLVEDALNFLVNPGGVESQAQRKGQIPEFRQTDPDSIIIFDLYNQSASIYDTENRSLTPTNIPAKYSLKEFSAVATHHQTTVFCGGVDKQKQVSNEVIIFNGTKWEQMTANMNSNRKGAAAVYVKAVLFVFGGETEIMQGSLRNALTESVNFERHPDGEKPWETVGNLLTPRSFASAVAVKDKAYLIGGLTDNDEQRVNACSTVEIFNTTSEKWSSSQVMNEARAKFGAAVLASRIYVVGGISLNSGCVTSTEFMDTADGVWSTITTTLPRFPTYASICCLKNSIYLSSTVLSGSLLKLDIPSMQWNNHYQERVCGNIAPFQAPRTYLDRGPSGWVATKKAFCRLF